MYFTVCIPTYNRGYILHRALESLENQSFDDFEVIVVDDGSRDDTKEKVDNYKIQSKLNIRYFYKNNGGKHTALNLGIKEACGKYFIILDSDDILTKDCLEFFYNKTQTNANDDNICGVIARCADFNNKKLIGKIFPKDNFITDYIDIHWGSGLSLFNTGYGDCLEAIKTSILKQYQWPEVNSTKFIPEDYVTDQIGLKYKLIGYNRIVEFKEYFTDGITKNQEIYKKKNIDGYLEKYFWNVKVLTQEKITFLAKFRIWYQYFYGLRLKKERGEYIDEKFIIKVPYFWKQLKKILVVLTALKNKLRKIN